jgi:hypothetical protein
VGKPEGERSLRRPGNGWLDNIQMDGLRDGMGWRGLGWIRCKSS